jgi:hypothetical protein
MMPNSDRKLNCIRLALYFNDGNCTITKSPQKDVKIGTRTKLGWWICLIGAWLIFGKPNDFRTVINPLWTEPPKEEPQCQTPIP